ncbi:hypothetical protein COCSUDRAFT_62952 [Coccomyxa subellipsoidea C-169]|uniref:Uncharacterized protein n=1 Tax=Coccomyxa subellipsoidea (strain C-169) TaxID=574566 RepID=I0YYE8_COCSC|nr:hypothetical protein COCSUDRAFT_62952 [Coccomyxa subellipsoidea C-169]EIE23417.1 hypothetical protein COCSUDRAFT_62952 [Coccomyxa subellipsoidea C-169]|eukprot:XP_005647961.1 hypothetical protein COCSUDRAFT_62952 [Coccomyxa subellipsoidea C-169]
MKPKQYSLPAKQQRPRSKRKAADSAVRDAYIANKTQPSPTSSTSSQSEQIIVESTPAKPRQSLRVRRSSTTPTSAPKTPPKGPNNLRSRPQTPQSTILTRSRRAFQQEEPVTPIESSQSNALEAAAVLGDLCCTNKPTLTALQPRFSPPAFPDFFYGTVDFLALTLKRRILDAHMREWFASFGCWYDLPDMCLPVKKRRLYRQVSPAASQSE